MIDQLLDSVRSKYGAVAESTLSNDHAGVKASALHDDLADLLSKYDVNAAAASVKVYAIKPGPSAQ